MPNASPHVHDFPWCDDFSAARNESLRHATGDWIFWLDADDRIRPSHVGTIRQILTQLDDLPRVFIFQTVLPPATLGMDRLFVSHPRLFSRHPELRWHGRVHEQLGPESVFEQYQKIAIDVEIEHIGYLDETFASRKARLKLRLLRMDYGVNPDDVNTLLHLGTTLHSLGDHHEAQRCLLRIFNGNTGPHAYMRRVCDMLIEHSYVKGDITGAASFAERGLVYFLRSDRLGHLATLAAQFVHAQNDLDVADVRLDVEAQAIHAAQAELQRLVESGQNPAARTEQLDHRSVREKLPPRPPWLRSAENPQPTRTPIPSQNAPPQPKISLSLPSTYLK